MLEKTVSNTLRMDLIRHVFPEAEFIYLERHGLDVVESSYRQWTMPVDRSYLLRKLRYFPAREWRYGLWFLRNMYRSSDSPSVWGPRYPGIELELTEEGLPATVARQWKSSVEAAVSSIRPDDCHCVSYALLDDRSFGFNHLLKMLQLTDQLDVKKRFHSRFQPVSSWPGELPKEILPEIKAIVESTQTHFDPNG